MIAKNDFSEAEVELFLTKIKEITPFPKIRDLSKILKDHFTLDKINAILKYLERSNLIIVDLDGNITWIKENNLKDNITIYESAKFSEDFLNYFNKKKTNK